MEVGTVAGIRNRVRSRGGMPTRPTGGKGDSGALDSGPGRVHGGKHVMLRGSRQADRDDVRGDEIGA